MKEQAKCKFIVSILGLCGCMVTFIMLTGCCVFLMFNIEQGNFVVVSAIVVFVYGALLLIMGIVICGPVIEVNESGMIKRLFGIVIKKYKWEDIIEIKYGTNMLLQRLSFYRNRKENAIFSRFIKRECIFFDCNKNKFEIFMRNAPENIVEQVKLKIQALN